MKTLDEVIKAWSICFSDISRSDCTGCPYADDDGDAACFNHDREDALHYLKAFRDAKNALDAERERTIDAYCQWKDAKEKLEAQTSQMMWVDKHFQFEISDNPPLTWDELKQMEGKPVWVEILEATDSDFVQYRWGNGAWYIVKDFVLGALAEYCQLTPNRRTWTKQSYGEAWQAYRKERS